MAEDHAPQILHRKRKRRRQDKPPLSANLIVDSQLKTDIGVLSEDLFKELFPGNKHSNSGSRELLSNSNETVRHVAIAPWFPLLGSATADASWTIFPVVTTKSVKFEDDKTSHSILRVSSSSTSIQIFGQALRTILPTKIQAAGTTPIEIRILDVIPVPLDTVFVKVDRVVTDKLESGEIDPRQFWEYQDDQSNGSTFSSSSTSKVLPGNHEAPRSRESLQKLVRGVVKRALQQAKTIHLGAALSLPLPTHPVTHAAQPPAKVIHCEPVQQGVLDSKTRIVVVRTREKQRAQVHKPLFRGIQSSLAVEEGDDTSDDRFFSAAEERTSPQIGSSPDEGVSEDEPDTDNVETGDDKREDHDSSDDSLEDLISLSAPLLSQTSGSTSAFQPGTPGGSKFGRQSNGPGTPGSVFSNYTSMTARPSGMEGRLFKTQGLSQKIPEDFIHPKPVIDEDEEVRIYVEVTALARLGCFSGDWVRIDCSSEQQTDGLGSWGMAFHSVEEDLNNWRAAKIYSIPELYSDRRRPHHLSSKRNDHQSSNGTNTQTPTALVYVSPILLANMNSPKFLRISRLQHTSNSAGAKIPGMSRSKVSRPFQYKSPPSAKEVTLLKVSTPLSTDRTLQPAIFAALKHYFEEKRRIVKTGDLLAIGIDEKLGRILHHTAIGEDTGNPTFLNVFQSNNTEPSNSTVINEVVWFKIGQVAAEKEEQSELEQEGNVWAGLATIEPTGTRMVQAGSERLRVPQAIESTWPYYLGARRRIPSEASKSLLGQIKNHRVLEIRRRLRELIAAATTPRAIHLGLKPIAVLLVSTQRNIGKATIAEQACADLGMHIFQVDAYDILTEGGDGGDVKTEAFFKARCERAINCGPESCALLIKHIDALAADRMAGALQEIIQCSRVLMATTTEIEKVPDSIRGLFTHELEISAPDEGEREIILQSAIENKGLVLSSSVDLGSVALKTAALVAGDLSDVVDRAAVAHQSRLESILLRVISDQENSALIGIRDVQISGGPTIRSITKSDFDVAVDAGRKNFADSIGAPKIPNVSWDDVGGLANVKDAVMETIQLPLERPELFAKGMKKRSGILFYGPPGTGKTLLAKAIATEFSLNFFSVKGPELLNMYIGESEANVRRVFQRARDARPCVVFFDELDSVAPKRGNQGDSGGVMDRIVSQLLAELDGMSNGDDSGGVFVIGATNRPDLLDAALLRPGRFDKMLYLGVSDTHEKQETILEALTRKFTLHPSLSLSRVAQALPFTYTGADLYALCSDAMLKAITRQATAVDEKISRLPGGPISTAQFFDHFATKEDIAVMVTEEDFVEAKRELVGSVSAKELEHYRRVQQSFESAEEDNNDRPMETTRKSSSQSSSEAPIANGKVGLKGKGVSGRFAHYNDNSDDSTALDEDLAIKTDHLRINGAAPKRSDVGRRLKGKGHLNGSKTSRFIDPSQDDDEELYS